MLLMVVVAVVVERLARPTPARPVPSLLLAGVVPAFVYVDVAIFIVVRAGMPV